ncbi:hypothetical protein KR038_003532, partial [Drosophila bunnanda]
QLRAKNLSNADVLQVPPLNQKRILAFVNHFLVNTCNFLNEFALGCETKFVEMERQLQKTEASLVILEAKLASIPTDHQVPNEGAGVPAQSEATEAPTPESEITPVSEKPVDEAPAEPAGVRACEDVRYRKFFKMLHVGVPAPAVKQKMQSEGLDPRLLE